MIYTPLTNKAMRIAYTAHLGQVDKSGLPYIFHPYHLAEQMTDEFSTCVALLHDVPEDTDVALEQLAEGFPPEVIEPLRLLIREEDVDDIAYIQAIRDDPIARAVKLADLAHDSDESRYAWCRDVTQEQLALRRQKYDQARSILMNVPCLVLVRVKTGDRIPIDVLPCVIGRKSPDARVDERFVRYELEDCSAVSREHILLTRQDRMFVVEDLNSTNGTFLNGERLGRYIRTQLSDGDRLSLGIEEFRVSIPAADE